MKRWGLCLLVLALAGCGGEREEDDGARPGRPDAGERRGSLAGARRTR